MKDAGLREEVVGELVNPCPTRVVLLTASPERAQPESLEVGAEFKHFRISDFSNNIRHLQTFSTHRNAN